MEFFEPTHSGETLQWRLFRLPIIVCDFSKPKRELYREMKFFCEVLEKPKDDTLVSLSLPKKNVVQIGIRIRVLLISSHAFRSKYKVNFV